MKNSDTAAQAEFFNKYALSTPYFFIHWDCPQTLLGQLSASTGTYVEIGAGDGTKLRSLLEDGALKFFTRIIATDIAPTRVSHIERYVKGVEAIVADGSQLPIADASSDFCFSDQVIEHVPDDRAMAREIRRVLRPGGRAYIGSVIKLPGAWYFYRNNGQWRIDPTHVREYGSKEEFARVFTDAGLVVDEIETTPIIFPVTDLVIRILVRIGLLNPEKIHNVYERSGLLKLLHKIGIPVPRYQTVGAYVHSPHISSLAFSTD